MKVSEFISYVFGRFLLELGFIFIGGFLDFYGVS